MSENLPIGWITANLFDICQPSQWKTISISDLLPDGYTVYGANGVIGFYDKYTHEKPTIMITCRGATCGNIHVSKPFSYINGNAMALDGLVEKLCHLKYLESFLQFRNFQDVISGSAQPQITRANLHIVSIPLAPYEEQARIVEKLEELLTDLDTATSELKTAQKKLTQYRQSLLKAAVEGQLTQAWRQHNPIQETGEQLLARILKERRARWEQKQLAKFTEQGKTPPKDWQTKYPEPVKPNVSELAVLPEGWFYTTLESFIPSDKTGTKTGPFGSLLKKHEHQPSGIPVIGIENIERMKYIHGSKIHISHEKAYELQDYELFTGDVVISRSGTVGEVCVIPDTLGEARFSTNIMRVRLNNAVMRPDYFCLLLNGSPFILAQIRYLCSGSTRDFLNTEILKTLIFLVPPIVEQDAILNGLNDALLATVAQEQAIKISLKQAAAQRKNILKSAFSGQLVPQNPNDEPASVLLERIKAERAKQEAAKKPSQRKAKEVV